jgi:hypothetical protein
MTPELLGELIRIHSQCVHDQQGRCPLAVFVKPLCWEINQMMGVTNQEDRGFSGSIRCAPRSRCVPVTRSWNDENV